MEIGDQVFARRYEELNLTVGLVVGDDRCLVIDTRGDAVQGQELAAAVRTITEVPWIVAITHSHFDHSFGASAFQPTDIWAHQTCRTSLMADGADQQAAWAKTYREQGKSEIASAIEDTEIQIPNQLVTKRAELDVGERLVVVQHFGPAHSDNDLLVHVTDADIVFAGDLVDNDAEPAFGADSNPFGWPSALDGLLGTEAETFVAGHGDPVDQEFVVAQRKQLADLAELCRGVTTRQLSVDEAVARSPFSAQTTRDAIAAAELVTEKGDLLPGW